MVLAVLRSLVLGCKSLYSSWRLKLGQEALQQLTLASTHSVVELSHLELQVRAARARGRTPATLSMHALQ